MGWPTQEQKVLDLAALKLEVELSEAYATPRSYGWLGEHQDEAAELAALLHEAAPRLALASLRAPARGARPLPKARSYEISDTIRDRLRAAEPMPTGPGEIPWSRLAACISSELLKFDDASDAAAADADAASLLQPPGSPAAPPLASPRSPCTPRGGDVLEVNSGGRVFFCLFDASTPAPTPPCSPRTSPERDRQRYGARAAAAAPGAGLGRGSGGEPTSGSWEGLYSEPTLAGPFPAVGGQPPPPLPQPLHAPADGGGGIGTSDSAQLLDGILASCALDSSCLSGFHFDPAVAAAAAAGAADDAGGGLPLPPTPAPLRRLVTAAFAGPQTCLVLKFVPSRLLCQSEQFAGELTRQLGLCAPATRVLRSKGASEAEWREATAAAEALRDRFPDLHEELGRSSCCLVMEFVPGCGLFRSPAAFAPASLGATAAALGRLFTLDMLLGNADRLRCRELSWRGNPENVLYATAGRWAGRVVAIDAVVQRRPPGGLKSVEDRSCERLTELALNDAEVAATLLRQALQPAAAHAAADPGALPEAELAAAFQQGLKAALEAAASIKGLLEMMFERLSEWIDEFIADIEEGEGGPPSAAASQPSATAGAQPAGGAGSGAGTGPGAQPAPTPRTASASRRASAAGAATSPLLAAAAAAASTQTMRIRQISHEAQRDRSVGEKVAHWKTVFREKGEELRAAVEEWQAKRGPPVGGQRLTTAFLDGTHPIVDVYELKVRLEHMLQRLRVLQQASLTGRPVRLLPRLFLSGAVEASSLHLLKHLGVTHILNATEDLLLPEDEHGFVTMRCPLRDLEEEDLRPLLPGATSFIDSALADGGSLLVHCHAGRSRSASLVLAWLMQRRSWQLDRALAFLRRARPEAAPNAGYLKALLGLEEELFGRQTVKMKKTKPEPRRCPECGERVGLSADSVRVHIKLKHPASALARSRQEGAAASAEHAGSPGRTARRGGGGGGAPAASPGSASASAASSPLSPPPRPSPFSQQQRQAGAALQTAAEVEAWQARVQRQMMLDPPAALGALRVAPRGQAAAQGGGCGEEELPNSPLAMDAALQAELAGASLCDGDAREEEEYLSAASTPGHPF